MPLDPQIVLATLRQVLGDVDFVALHEPKFAGNEWDYVKECLDTGWVSSAGKYVDEFEDRLASVCGVKHAVAVVNGTAALHTALMVAGVGPGDEVIIPALTFVATANAVTHCGAVPHLADCEERTLGLDPARLAEHLERIAERRNDGCINRDTGRRIAAIVPMHTFGHPVDIDPLIALCDRFGIPLVEDAAESMGSRYKGQPCGAFGRVAALSFNGNKIMTTGGGGAVLTDDAELAATARHITTTGKKPHRWAFDHDMVAWNYRLPNINAALGCAQLEQLDGFLVAKRRLADTYRAAFADVAGLRFFDAADFADSNYWLNALLLDPGEAHRRDDLLGLLNDQGIMARPAWTPMHRLPMYADAPRMTLPITDDLERRIVNLPSSAELGTADAA